MVVLTSEGNPSYFEGQRCTRQLGNNSQTGTLGSAMDFGSSDCTRWEFQGEIHIFAIGGTGMDSQNEKIAFDTPQGHIQSMELILCKLAYSLAVTTFTETTMSRYHEANFMGMTPKAGCLRQWSLTPLRYAGLNIPSLYMEQFVTQLTMALQYGDKQEDTTRLLIFAMAESLKLETGIAGDLFQTPVIFQDLIMDTWIKQLWLDCIHFGIKIAMDLLDFLIQDLETLN